MKKQLLSILSFVIIGLSANAQWVQTICPGTGNSVYSLGIDMSVSFGTNIFAGTNNGVYWTPNNVNICDADNFSLTDSIVNAFIVSGNTIYAGTAHGVFSSPVYGGNWTSLGLSTYNITSFATSGSNIFAGTTTNGVYLSTNSGLTWTTVNTGLTNLHINTLTNIGSTILAGTSGFGVFVTSNNGTSWAMSNTGLTYHYVYALGTCGSNVYVASDDGNFNNGVYISSNNGSTWTLQTSGLPFGSSQHVIGSSGNNVFVGTGNGVYWKTNSGTGGWTAMNTGLPNFTNVKSFAFTTTDIYAGVLNTGVWTYPLSIVTGIKESTEESTFSIAPNPFTLQTTITFSAEQKNTTIKITDILGKDIRTINFTGRQLVIDKAEMKAGIYFVQTTDEQKNVTNKKIIIQ